MNADLAAVNKRHGQVGYPLRNRSASSNSGDGTQNRPDPNRYKKYLSLRNRKIVERQNHYEDTHNSNNTTSHRTLDSQVQDQQKPMQPILKSTSSRVSDLRYRGDGSLHKTESTESMPQHQPEQQIVADIRTRDHSPLRVKSQNSNTDKGAHSNSHPGSQCSPDQRQRSPIQVYQCTREDRSVEEQKVPKVIGVEAHTFNTTSQSNINADQNRRKSSLERSARSRGGTTTQGHDPFKSTVVGEDEEDFHFDFDQDGNCSYVNTTMQSEATTPKEARNSAKRIQQSNIQQLGTLSQKAETLAAIKKASIRAYADELKDCVQSGVAETAHNEGASDDELAGDESSGYIIDYEQVLKDNSTRQTPPYMTDYREDVGQDTILEQTQEAIETDSSPNAYRRNQNSKRHLRQQRKSTSSNSSPPPMQQQQDSPQFRRNFTNESEQRSRKQQSSSKKSNKNNGASRFVDEVTQIILQRKVGSKESPNIRDNGSDTLSDYQNDNRRQQQYDRHIIQNNDQQEPIITFENRQPASSQRTTTLGEENLMQNTAGPVLSSEDDDTDTARDNHGIDVDRVYGNGNSSANQQVVDRSQGGRFEQSRFKPYAPEQIVYSHDEDGESDTDQQNQLMNPNMHRSPDNIPGTQLAYDMTTSNKKLALQNEEIEQEFERQSYGSQPPSGNLVVTCIIRQPMETVGLKGFNQKSQYRTSIAADQQAYQDHPANNVLSTARTSKSHYSGGAPGSIRPGGISNSVGPTLNRHGLNKSSNGLDISKISSFSGNRNRSASRPRDNSQDSRSNLSAGGTRRRSSQPKTGGVMKQIPNANKHPHILTTQQPSKYVLRSPPGLQAQLLNILLKSEQDMKHCQLAFDEHGIQSKQKGRKTMKVFEFDNCIGETKAHSLALGLDQHVKWISQTRGHLQQTTGSKNSTSSPKNVIFLFGQSDALKTQLLNVMTTNSLINQCLKARDIRFLRVSTYHSNQEYLLAHKQFGNKQQMRREIGMELREAFRERDLNAKKIALKLSTYTKTIKAEDVKNASHLIVQLDDIVFIDLADIDNLKDSSMAKKISADFSIVTNAILSMSPYYKDHDFGKVEEDRLAPYMETNSFRTGSLSFKNQINRLVSKRSRVLLLCCVIQCSMAGTQAVDYCHKIRSYFHGTAAGGENSIDMTPTRRMHQLQNPDMSMDTDQNVNAFKQLGGLISEVSKARLFIDKVFTNKTRGEPLKRSRNQLKEMVACLRDDVSDLLNSLAANNESYIHQLKKIREMLQGEIFYMREKVTAMRSLGRKNSAGGSSHKSGHALCILPKTMLQQHSSVQVKRGSSTNIGQKRNSRDNLHNFRPQSQTSFHSANGSRPQSGKVLTNKNAKQTMQPRRSTQNLQQQQHATTQSNRVKSNSQSRKNTASKQKSGTPRMPFHQYENNNPTTFSSQQPNQFEVSSSHKRLVESGSTPNNKHNYLRKSHESLPVTRDIKHQNSSVSLKSLPMVPQSRRQSGSKVSKISSRNNNPSSQQNIIMSHRNQTVTSGNKASQMTTNGQNNEDLSQVEYTRKKSTSAKKQQQNSRFSTQQLSFGAQKQLVGSQEVKTVPDDFRKQTLSSLNQQYLLSGTKSCNVQESTETPIAATEQLHQEIYGLKEQLKQAIEFSEEQAAKRQQADQNCIKLTKKLSMAETSVADLDDRIMAKDQTIRSLESQLDFHKNKLQQSQQEQKQHQLMESPVNEESIHLQKNSELEVLKVEKAQTDQMNQEILGQISMLKEALSTFQEQERTNQKILRKQNEKDAEMQELKSQVAQLIQSKNTVEREQSPGVDVKQMKQKLEELQYAKEKYREEALHLKQEIRQQKFEQQAVPERGSRERKSTISSLKNRKESQDREPLHIHSRISSHQNYNHNHNSVAAAATNSHPQLVPQQDQQAQTQNMPQQKSLNTIKNMIRDFKEQRKGLMRTTSSREALMQQQQSQGSRQVAGKAAGSSTAQKKPHLRSSRSRENDEREGNRQNQNKQNAATQGNERNSGYAHLNSHFR